jgi:hypothetical protein
MGYIRVFTENTDGSWNLRTAGFGPFNYTFPGNQYGSTQTHEWIFTQWIGDDGDQTESGYGAFGGVANDQVIGLNQTITINTDWYNIYYLAEFYFRIHNLRNTIVPSTIIYEGNGSIEGSTTSNTATSGSSFTFQANGFTKTGYTFYRWDLYNSNNIYEESYIASSTITWTRSGNYTAKASWSANTYTITYDANGVNGDTSGIMTDSTATYDSTFTFKANGFTRTGYAFFKWDLYESNGTTRLDKEYNSEQSYGIWNIPYNIIAKAKWNVDLYTVTFNSNGKGTGKTVTQSVGTTVTCPILKAVGYVFGGWATSAASTTVNKAGNATFVLGAANQSFFAIWTENTNGSVSFSELQAVYDGTHPIGISEYRTQSGQTTANSQIALSANFKGKGPAP